MTPVPNERRVEFALGSLTEATYNGCDQPNSGLARIVSPVQHAAPSLLSS